MRNFAHHAARARCQSIAQDGLASVDFFGPWNEGAFQMLVPQVLEATQHARVLLINTQQCLMLTDSRKDAQVSGYSGKTPPGCLIVRADQFDYWSRLAVRLAREGIRRVVFLDSQLPLAHQWLQRRSLPDALPAL